MAIITADLNDKRYETFKEICARFRSRLQGYITTMAAGPVKSDVVLTLYKQIAQFRTNIETIAAISGVDTFVKNAEDNQTYVLTTEIAATVTEIDAAIAWIDSYFPQSGGYRLTVVISGGAITQRSFAASATSGLRSALQDVVDTLSAPS